MRRKAEKFVDLFTKNKEEKPDHDEKAGGAGLAQPSKSDNGGKQGEKEEEEEELFEVVKDTAWDGIKYLGSDNQNTRTMWMIVITAFVALSLLQISFQVQQFLSNPVATNIEVEYPAKVNFPAIAICNNNQFRLSYLAQQHAKLKAEQLNSTNQLKSVSGTPENPFDQVIANLADLPASEFMKNASHQIEDLVMRCILPDGTECDSSHFVPFQTVNGLCWAINTDRFNPIEVPGSGSEYALRLLLNMESYERIESKHRYFGAHSLPGVQILIFNQTDPPHLTNGINIPPGFTSYLPITMQQLSKLPKSGCQVESDESKTAYDEDFFSPDNIRACKYRKYLGKVEQKCHCSMRGIFKDYLKESYHAREVTRPCNVDDYFSCVRPVLKQVTESGIANRCLPPCESFEYSAWQDLNRMPKGVLTPPIERELLMTELRRRRRRSPVESESTLETTPPPEYPEKNEDYADLDDDNTYTVSTTQKFVRITEPLPQQQADRIRTQASFAFESQHKYQEDIAERYQKLAENVKNAKQNLFNENWGWNSRNFKGVYKRLTESTDCIQNITHTYKEIVFYLARPPNRAEEKSVELLLSLVDNQTWSENQHKYKTMAELWNTYGDKAETRQKEMDFIIGMAKDIWSIFDERSYTPTITQSLSEMDWNINNAKKVLAHGGSGLEKWARLMGSAGKQYFANEEFHEAWYRTISKDIDQTLLKSITRLFNTGFQPFNALKKKGDSHLITAATVFFGRQPSAENVTHVRNFFADTRSCMDDVQSSAYEMHEYFTVYYKVFKHSYDALFKDELKKLLDKFEFGEQFEKDNFAMVNIYINKMVVEKWSQEETYSFWSLASDIGGSLGLFLGASLVSIIEIIYIFFHFGVGKKVAKRLEERRESRRSKALSAEQTQTLPLQPLDGKAPPV